MTVDELAAKLEEDGRNHERRGVRRRCTPERCRRVAERALIEPEASSERIVEMCASQEPDAHERARSGNVDTDGYGFAWITLLWPILQLVLQFLASRAVAHIQEDA